jgi:bacillolysin
MTGARLFHVQKLGILSAIVGGVLLMQADGLAQRSTAVRIHATSSDELREWDGVITRGERARELSVFSAERDPSLPGRTIERLQQFHQGVPVWGSTVVRDVDGGLVRSIFGTLSPELTLDTTAALTPDDIRARFLDSGSTLVREPALIVLPLDSGEHRLAYSAVASRDAAVDRVFLDASTGVELLRYSEIKTQGAVGTGTGVLGDAKKVSAVLEGGAYWADDQLRPPVLKTYDMRGNLARLLQVLPGGALFPSDRASDTDNSWDDRVAVDAHGYIGWTYDYYFKRHGRRGLDNRDRPIVALINGVSQQGALALPPALLNFALNAFWCDVCGPAGVGVMYFGNGMPPGLALVSTGQNIGYWAGALDVVAHELTHGITDSSSGLIYQNESGALNEAFSDMMGTSIEFYYANAGSGGGTDYLIGEDAVRGLSRNGVRSMSNPAAYGDPDHYSQRFTGTSDGGGVHINSAIPNQAFFLAIEGGTNRTSGLAVQGVGAANREQIEKTFYRAVVFLLPSNASFSTARAATIQAARDLYGTGSAPERAVTQAWSAVGVF